MPWDFSLTYFQEKKENEHNSRKIKQNETGLKRQLNQKQPYMDMNLNVHRKVKISSQVKMAEQREGNLRVQKRHVYLHYKKQHERSTRTVIEK